MKRWLAYLLSAVLLLSLTGCAFYKENNSETEKNTIVISVLAGQSTSDAGVEDMIDEWMEKNFPQVYLEWECVDWGDQFNTQMKSRIAAGEIPDIMIGKAQDVSTYAPKGVLGEIDEKYLDRGLDAARENVTVDGKTYGLVYNAMYQGVYYNKQMFKDNGWSVPETQEDLQKIIDDCKAKGITPFASHMVDTWSIGNMTMQFMMNDVFNKDESWGDEFRNGETSFSDSKEAQTAYQYNKLIYDNTFPETFSTEQTDCDAKMVQGEAAMKVSGSWSIQNFLDIDENFDFGIFPFPNQAGDAKLIKETNMTFMKSAKTEQEDLIDQIFNRLLSDRKLAQEFADFTQSSSLIEWVTDNSQNKIQSDIQSYEEKNEVIDVTTGNEQLIWTFQKKVAEQQLLWLNKKISLEDALKYADDHREQSFE